MHDVNLPPVFNDKWGSGQESGHLLHFVVTDQTRSFNLKEKCIEDIIVIIMHCIIVVNLKINIIEVMMWHRFSNN